MTSILPNSRRPDLTVCASGRIDITSRIARTLDLQPGDIIDVSYSDREYYLYIRRRASDAVGRHEGHCFPTLRGRNRGSYRTWSVRLAKAIHKACNNNTPTLRLPCGEARIVNERVYIPIIIHCKL